VIFHNGLAAETCSGSEKGSYLRLTDLCITQLMRVMKKKKAGRHQQDFFFCITLELSDTTIYEPYTPDDGQRRRAPFQEYPGENPVRVPSTG